MVVAYQFDLHHSFGGTQKDQISIINPRIPLNLIYKRIFLFFFLFVFLDFSQHQAIRRRRRGLGPRMVLFSVQACCGDKIKQMIEVITSVASPGLGIK